MNTVFPFWPILVYFAGVIGLAGSMIVISWFLGERLHQGGGAKNSEPYESGVVSTGSARLRLSAKFYLIAMFFVIFDLETAFVFAWALVVEEAGWVGYAEISIFIGVLMAALVYLWKLGALDWWGIRGKKIK